MTEGKLLERKVDSRIGHLKEVVLARRAQVALWRVGSAKPYLDGGIPLPGRGWREVAPPYQWELTGGALWFLATATVPEGWGSGPLVLQLSVGSEAQVFVNGQACQSVSEPFYPRGELVLADEAQPGDSFELAVEITKAPDFGPGSQVLSRSEIVEYRDAVRDLLYWLRVTLEAAQAMPEESARRLRMIRILDRALQRIHLRGPDAPAFEQSCRSAIRQIRKDIAQTVGDAGPGNLTLIGHAHIDTAWLWPIVETRRKCGRTFTNVLRLMEQYPDLYFSQSQAQLYQFTKENFPRVYEQITARIAEGRWDAVGGAWVECDCNLPSGESLIRQFLYGKRFFREEFGSESAVGWWPDAFGYPWSLPQIMVHCGLTRFFSTKLTWNQYNTFPCGHFWWEGIDGTRVLAVSGQPSYNGAAKPGELTSYWAALPERDRVDESLYTFGWGDGGGGPTEEMVEYVARQANMPGVPACRFGTTQEAFDRIEAQSSDLPTWNGELYLELHRGCQTSQARTKRYNRKLELLLRDLEQLGVAAEALVGAEYPGEELGSMWRRLLCYQFHDILPGTSIRQVYAEAEEDYAAMMARGVSLRDRMLRAVAARVDTRGSGAPVVVWNTLSWERTDLVEVTVRSTAEGLAAVGPDGKATSCQILSRENGRVRVLFLAEKIPAFGYAVFHLRAAQPAARKGPVRASRTRLENETLRVRFDRRGRVTSIYDKSVGREVLGEGQAGNLLRCFHDRPYAWDAWDIDPWFEEQSWEPEPPDTIEVIEAGPVRASVRLTCRTGQSVITQDVRLCAGSQRLDFVTRVEWHERRTLLKCAFPVGVHASEATFEIQFGAIARPTHRNTSWDRAKFEVPAHRWADLSEGDYGVALLNDCKYGYDVRDNVLRLSLLRSPTKPDPEADQGEHEFTYSLYPHKGGWRDGAVVRQGLELNVPLLGVSVGARSGDLPTCWSAASVDRDSVIIETLKKAEDGEGVVLRLYEAHGGRGPLTVRTALPVAAALECNGIEDVVGSAELADGELRTSVRPWQVRSFLLR